MYTYTQKMYKAEHKKVLWMAEGSQLYQAGWPWGLCHQLRGVVSDLGVPSVLVSHPTWFYLSGLFLEWLFFSLHLSRLSACRGELPGIYMI